MNDDIFELVVVDDTDPTNTATRLKRASEVPAYEAELKRQGFSIRERKAIELRDTPAAAESMAKQSATNPKDVLSSGFLRGLTLDWADEAAGLSNRGGRETAEAMRARKQLEQETSPITAFAGELIGGIAPYATGAATGAKLGGRGGPYGALIGGALGAGAVGAAEALGGSQGDATAGDVAKEGGLAAAMQLIGGMPVKKGAAVIKRLLGLTDEGAQAARRGQLAAVEEAAMREAIAKGEVAAATSYREKAYDAATQKSMQKMEVPLNSPEAMRARKAFMAEAAAKEAADKTADALRALGETQRRIGTDLAQEGMAATGIAPAITAALPDGSDEGVDALAQEIARLESDAAALQASDTPLALQGALDLAIRKGDQPAIEALQRRITPRPTGGGLRRMSRPDPATKLQIDSLLADYRDAQSRASRDPDEARRAAGLLAKIKQLRG